MTYPPPSGGWSDPTWSGQQSGPPADPTLAAGSPIPAQPGGDPYAPASPYAGAQQPTDPYAAPHPGGPHADVHKGGDPYAGGYPPPPYGGQGYGYAPPQQRTNGLAIAAMVVSIVGALGLCGYGLGGYIGLVGAILGHVSRKQIRERGEGGEGFATAGIIVGWISLALAVLATIALVIFFVWLANQDPSSYDSTTY